jgi:septum formation protein
MLKDKLRNYKLILASNSARRQFLLKEAGFDFDLRIISEIPEVYPPEMNPEEVPLHLAKVKASYFEGQLEQNEIVLTADTVVILNERVLGKPADYNDALNMLTSLSGAKHQVITGVCLKSKDKERLFSASSYVWFRNLSDEEIKYYINECKPYDKAGAYGAQEWIGYIGVERIEGSFFNVMGLPIQMVYVELEKFIET